MSGAAKRAGDDTRADALPDIIQLPDQSQPEPPPSPAPKPGRHTGRMKGRHFGPRPVADPLDAWLPPTRCTKAQRAAFEAAAAEAGLSLNAYQREKLFGDPGPRVHRRRPSSKSGLEGTAVSRIAAALGSSGNNLNQLLRRVNAYDFRGIPELVEMARAMTAAHAMHHALVAAIKADMGL